MTRITATGKVIGVMKIEEMAAKKFQIAKKTVVTTSDRNNG